MLEGAEKISKRQADEKALQEYERYASTQRLIKEQQGELEALLQW